MGGLKYQVNHQFKEFSPRDLGPVIAHIYPPLFTHRILLLPDKLSQECRGTDEVYKMICIHALTQHCQCKWQLFEKLYQMYQLKEPAKPRKSQ